MPANTDNRKYQYNRSNRLLRKKFGQYLVPTMITMAAMSLNEFVDSMVVSRLLGSEGLAIVSLGAPVMLMIAAVFSLLGSGGATVYAFAIGKRDHEEAGRSFTAAMLAGALIGIVMMLLGYLFFNGLAEALCKDPMIKAHFDHYLRVLLISVPLLITILVYVEFLPPAGLPGYATAVNVVANVVNIIMDYVYIRVVGMGVEGAAWATLTGYICALFVVVYAILRKKLKIHISKNIGASLKGLPEIIKLGAADAVTQLGFTLQYAVSNGLAQSLAGISGVVAYSLCQQSLSIISIFMSALIGASSTMMAVLHGQHDYRGQNTILVMALKSQLAATVVCVAGFIAFAPQAAALYNITEPGQAAMAIRALRVFSLCYIFRSPIIVYFRYLRVLGMAGYATLVSALDGFLGIIPVIMIMTQFIGVEGIWWAYPVTCALVLVFIIIRNRMILARSEGRYKGILLRERDVDVKPVMDITITKDATEIVGVSNRLQEICQENGIDSVISMRAALAVEEMAVYSSNHKKQDAYMDILVRIFEGNVEIDFRSLGIPFENLDESGEDEMEVNMQMLKGVASHIDNEYIMGMNATRITVAGKAATAEA